jgi:hypothetical protein
MASLLECIFIIRHGNDFATMRFIFDRHNYTRLLRGDSCVYCDVPGELACNLD